MGFKKRKLPELQNKYNLSEKETRILESLSKKKWLYVVEVEKMTGIERKEIYKIASKLDRSYLSLSSPFISRYSDKRIKENLCFSNIYSELRKILSENKIPHEQLTQLEFRWSIDLFKNLLLAPLDVRESIVENLNKIQSIQSEPEDVDEPELINCFPKRIRDEILDE